MSQAQRLYQPAPFAAEPRPTAPDAPRRLGLLERVFQFLALVWQGDLAKMGAILFLVSGVGGAGVLYLTAFARLTAQGAKLDQVAAEVRATELENAETSGQITQYNRPDRVRREAQRLGLKPMSPADTERIRASAVAPAAAPRPAAAPAKPAAKAAKPVKAAAAQRSLQHVTANAAPVD